MFSHYSPAQVHSVVSSIVQRTLSDFLSYGQCSAIDYAEPAELSNGYRMSVSIKFFDDPAGDPRHYRTEETSVYVVPSIICQSKGFAPFNRAYWIS